MSEAPAPRGRVLLRAALAVAFAGVAAAIVPREVALPAGLIVLCLALWLAEILPPFAPTLLMLGTAPLVLADRSAVAATKTVLSWAADPVLALFFGGLAAGAAARKHGLDERIARAFIDRSRGSPRLLVGLLMVGTAGLSMWMSNVAAAAMMIGASRPALAALKAPAAKSAALVGIAMAANVAGLSTPVGSGPNGIAIAAVEDRANVTFAGWLLFGLPLAIGLVAVVYLHVRRQVPAERFVVERPLAAPALGRGAKLTIVFVAIAIALWLAEPVVGVPAPVVSLVLGAALFTFGPLGATDLQRIDWSTLLLIAGGVVLGRLTEATGLLDGATAAVRAAALSPLLLRLLLCAAAAALSALMSNTATAALLIPVAVEVDPSPATAILVAVATSLGVPFVVSTPPNAMVVGEGVSGRQLLGIGLVVMVGGVLLVAITGPWVLGWFVG